MTDAMGSVVGERLVFRVLGPIEVGRGDGRGLDVGGAQQRRLLGVLLANAGRLVPAAHLIEVLWPGGDNATADAAVRTYVSRLRRSLGDPQVVRTEPPGYRVDLSAADLDADRFEELAAATRAHAAADRHAEVVERAGRALALWRGRAYGDLADEPWAQAEVARLEELRLVVIEDLAAAQLATGRHHDVVADLRRWCVEHPRRERLRGHLALALHRAGDHAGALQALTEHRRLLADATGLHPGAELEQLEARILARDPGLLLIERDGLRLRSYVLGAQLGEGAFAEVFEGTQPSVGRPVAVKVIRAELANRPEFIRRFEAEAHLVARLEHPHIVPLYDYWREPDRACLVMRYLRGGTLEQRLASEGPLGADEVATLVTQVGAALATAHRAGVVHRDVKPANVFLDGEGNYYLGDFGIALEATAAADPESSLSAGSPAYASPEQLRRQPVGPPADVHGLAITVYEALTAQLPFPTETTRAGLLRRQLEDPIPPVRAVRRDVPPVLDDVLARAAAKAPEDRYQDVASFVAALRAALGDREPAGRGIGPRQAATAITFDDRNPYKGLRPFSEADEGDFFGRARLVDQLVGLLARPGTAGRVLAVVGPSGIGKSSVVRAGLLPALRRGAVEGSARWFVAAMVPGRDPFEELAPALLKVAADAPADLARLLADDRRGLDRAVRSITADGGELLLLVDQFEELFTQTVDEAVRRRFLDALEYALTDQNCPLRLAFTLRADFYDRLLRYGEFARLVKDSTVPVLPLAADELERAIVDPALRVGAAFEPGLVSRIVADVADQGAALPILQYALTELYEMRLSGMLTAASYEHLGGVAGALTRRAEELHTSGTAAEQAATRRVFGRLVTLGEGTEDTRRRVLRAELGTDPATVAAIDRFADARLLTFDRDIETREPTVEVAHEALIRQWPRLRAWLDADRDDLRLQRQLAEAARSWERSGRDDGELYRGGRLELAEAWVAAHPDELNPLEAQFLATSTERRRDEQAAARRHVRRLRGALAGVGVVAVVALVAGLLALRQQRRADNEADRATAAAAEAETRRLVADAAALVGENRDVALLLASEAYRRDPGPQTLAGLQRVLTSTGPYLGTIGAGEDFLAAHALSDGTIVGVTASEVRFYDGGTWALTRTVPLPAKAAAVFGSVPVDVRGEVVAVGTEAGTVALVQGSAVRSIAVGSVVVRAIALGDGVLVAGDVDGTVRLLDIPSGEQRWAVKVAVERTYREAYGEQRWTALHEGIRSFLTSWEGAIFGHGASELVLTRNQTVLVATGVRLRELDAADGRVLRETRVVDVNGAPRSATHVDEAPGGSFVVASSNWAARVDETLGAVTPAFVPTGRSDLNVIAHAVLADPFGEVWFGLDNGQLVRGFASSPLDAGENPGTGLSDVRQLSLAPGGGSVLVAGAGGIVVWAIDGRQLLARAVPREGNSGAILAIDGSALAVATTSATGDVGLYDLTTDPPRRRDTTDLPPYAGYGYYDPLGRFLEGFDNGTNRVLDPKTFQEIVAIPDVSFGAYSRDGRFQVNASWNEPTISVLEVGSWKQVSPTIDLSPWTAPEGRFNPVPGFDATGERVYASLQDTGTTVVFDTTSWELLQVIGASDHGGVIAAGFSDDGMTLVTLGIDGTIALRDARTWAFVREIAGGVSATDNLDPGVYLSADGVFLLTTRDTQPRLWHLPSGTVIGAFPHRAGLVASGVGIGPQLRLVTMGGDHALIWNLDVTSWPDIACRAAGRNFTSAEWAQFGPKGVPYAATCAQWPAAA